MSVTWSSICTSLTKMIEDIHSAVNRIPSREFTHSSRYYFRLFEQLSNNTIKIYDII